MTYLQHHGIKGQKWGVRRFQNDDGSLTNAGKSRYGKSELRKNYDEKKAAYKAEKKNWKKAFNTAYNKSGIHLTKKGRDADTKRWENEYDAWEKMDLAKTLYKNVKSERNTNLKNTFKDIQKNSSIGEKLTFNNATRRRAAKYVVDNNMSVSDAKKKANTEAIRNTALILAVIGGSTIVNMSTRR